MKNSLKGPKSTFELKKIVNKLENRLTTIK